MERTIDRSSYRRSIRNEVKKEVIIKEKKFNYIQIFLNQIIVSLLIIVTILTEKYFDIDVLDKLISKYMAEGYSMQEVFNFAQNFLNIENLNSINVNASGDESEQLYFIASGEESVSGDSGETVFKTAVEGVNQMLDDAQYVKENYEFVIPADGTITSEFGCRISDNEIISSYHTGLDIAANTGTKIYAAHNGTVIMSKLFSTYGNCIMIQNGDLITVYAHCSSLNVTEGENVKKGDFIGKMGMTGNATGPHLHFEVKYKDRYINPKDILGDI